MSVLVGLMFHDPGDSWAQSVQPAFIGNEHSMDAPDFSSPDFSSINEPFLADEESNGPGVIRSQVNSSQIACLPGQFPSAFSDVLPGHWAYEVVNRLASRPIQCFDLPEHAGDRPNR